jgi:3-hydroxyisobutyrate dehydrogenase
MGTNLFHVGKNGSGLAVKIVNNMLLGISMAAAGEVFNIIEKLGVDKNIFYDIVSKSTGASWALNKNCPVPGIVMDSPASNNYGPGFASSLMLKDLRLSQEVALKFQLIFAAWWSGDVDMRFPRNFVFHEVVCKLD